MADERRQAVEWLEEMGFVILESEAAAQGKQDADSANPHRLSRQPSTKRAIKSEDSAA